MKKIFGVLILGLLTVAAFSMPARADDKAGCQGIKVGMHEKMPGVMREKTDKKIDLDEMFFHKAHLILENATELGLSDDQLQKIKRLKMSTKKSLIKSDAEVELLVLDIEEALENDEIDVGNINTLIDKKYNLKSQEAKTLLGAYADLKKVLSQDQMKKLHDIWNKQKCEGGKCVMMGAKEEHAHKMGMH